MSANGVPIEEIAHLAGHNRTATTEPVYRHELRPVITTGAEVMDRILSSLSYRSPCSPDNSTDKYFPAESLDATIFFAHLYVA